ncbi:sodium-dependent transporter [Ectothiorhodospiraceae bacterium WFHF3C12]|nr:sodium-dependent transporter [Ectothiorhodospiraceae bacterium WFHF3C12]
MANEKRSIHGQWSSSLAFILAATGSAVGLGNIWRFPYMLGENGGGAFLLVYLACVLLIGIPVMMAEISIGRRARQSPINALDSLAQEEGRTRNWRLLGWLGVLAGFFILSFYSVVAGWILDYTVKALLGAFEGLTVPQAEATFGHLLGSPWVLALWHTLFLLLCYAIVARGVEAGLERAVRWLMPLLFLMMLALVVYGMIYGDFARTLTFMFSPDWSRLSATGVLEAMGQAFFTLSLGMGAIMVYGSYLPSGASIPRTTIAIAVADTLIAITAGLAVFPVVFGELGEVSQKVGLIFHSLPVAFGGIPMGSLFGFLFFLLVSFAALTSGISLLEPITAYFVENRGWARPKAVGITGAIIWLLGLGSVLSFNAWSGFAPLAFLGATADGPGPFAGMTVFDILDGLTANVMLPLGGLGIAVFVGWMMKRQSVIEEIGLGDSGIFRTWWWLVRTLTPAAVVLILLNSVGVF